MIKKIAYFAVMLFVCIFVAFYSNAKIDVLKKNILKIDANYESQKDSLIKIIEMLMTANHINESKINNCIVRNTSTDEEVKLFDILDNHQTIIIRLINTGCNPCNQDQIEMLKRLVGLDNLVILANLTNMKLLRLFLNENNISAVYWLKDTDILFQEDDNTKILVSYVNREGTILRAYHIDLNMLYIVQSLVY
jgi:hypothetical protein